jgi:hypothetical protein
MTTEGIQLAKVFRDAEPTSKRLIVGLAKLIVDSNK